MATARVLEYLHSPVPQEFKDFILKESRLQGVDLTIAQNYLAEPEYDTDGYAQLVHMDKHNFSRHSGTVFRALMRVLIRLALDAWEQQNK